MFEKATPVPAIQTDRFGGEEALDADTLSDTALRDVDWSEITARLSAARDLRQVLSRETDRSIGASANDFADAAARYFRTREEGEANVNPVALGHRKGSPGMFPEQEELDNTETDLRGLLKKKGDARDDR